MENEKIEITQKTIDSIVVPKDTNILTTLDGKRGVIIIKSVESDIELIFSYDDYDFLRKLMNRVMHRRRAKLARFGKNNENKK